MSAQLQSSRLNCPNATILGGIRSSSVRQQIQVVRPSSQRSNNFSRNARIEATTTRSSGRQAEACSPVAFRAAPLELAQRLLAAGIPKSIESWMIIGVLGAAVLLAGPEPASAAEHLGTVAHHSPAIGDLAEDTEFWSNVLRYISYFFSVLLGTAYVAIKPIIALLKRPTTAIFVILGGAALYFFVSTTVGAMLGLNDIIEYEPSSIVTPMQ